MNWHLRLLFPLRCLLTPEGMMYKLINASNSLVGGGGGDNVTSPEVSTEQVLMNYLGLEQKNIDLPRYFK